MAGEADSLSPGLLRGPGPDPAGPDSADPPADDPPVHPTTLPGHRAPRRSLVVAALRDRLPPTVQGARWSLDGRALVVVALVAVLAVTVAVLLSARSPRTEAVLTPRVAAVTTVPTPTVAPTLNGPLAPAPGEPVTGVVVVDVSGLVARPGVYELPGGSRVVDALEVAGGPVDGADLSTLNLARLLVDGEQVAVGVPPAPVPPGGSVDGPGPHGGPSAPLDLNLASEAELDALPGVGPVLAARIVAWRELNGRFSSVEELLEVSGIGESTLADIAPLVRV